MASAKASASANSATSPADSSTPKASASEAGASSSASASPLTPATAASASASAALRSYDMRIHINEPKEVRYQYSLSQEIGALGGSTSTQTMQEVKETYKIRFEPASEGKMEVDSTIEASDTVYYDLTNGERSNERSSYYISSLDAQPSASASASATPTPTAEATASAEPVPTPSATPIPSRHFQAVIKVDGDLVEIKNKEELFQQLFPGYYTYISSLPESDPSRQYFEDNYASRLEVLIGQHFSPFFAVYPQQTVRLGDSWVTRNPVITNSSYVTRGYTIKQKVSFSWRLNQVGETLKLGYIGEQEIYISSLKLNLRYKGEAQVDAASGLLKELKVTTTLTDAKGKSSIPLIFAVSQL
ncbi:MAG: hypothetical protein ACAI44_27035 [Candidatus Sericytochromatia bacterium]